MPSSNMKMAGDPHSTVPMIADLLEKELRFPAGLLGFPAAQRFILAPFQVAEPVESPFLVLNSLDQELSFVVIEPSLVAPDYHVRVSVELSHLLAVRSASELVPLAIVTVRDQIEAVTVNLQGPVVINVTSRLGAQAVLEEYPLRHPLVAAP